MSKYIFFLIISAIVILTSVSGGLLLRFANRRIWQKKTLRFLSNGLLFSAVFLIIISFLLGFLNAEKLFPYLLAAALLIVLISISLILSLPFSLLSHKTAKLLKKPLNRNRRDFIKGISAAFPLILTGSSVYGFGDSFNKVKIREIPFYFENLAQDLQDLKILHLSDLHLHAFFTLSDLEEIIPGLLRHKPHLILITGDIADDLRLLPESLNLINSIKPKLGGFISVGNHEYYRGIKSVIKIIDKSPFPLLLNKGQTVKIGNTSLFIGGLDDPRTLSAENHRFLQRSLDKTLNYNHHSDFNIIMSHRPSALDIASEQNIDLVLSGHTHGGQMGFNGRSIFEGLVKEKYLWGKYQKGKTQLYTSAGVGHWLPFRLGCPAEAVIITLKKSNIG